MLQNSDCDVSDSSDQIFSSSSFFLQFFLQHKNFTKKLKTQILMNLKNSNCDKTQKLKL